MTRARYACAWTLATGLVRSCYRNTYVVPAHKYSILLHIKKVNQGPLRDPGFKTRPFDLFPSVPVLNLQFTGTYPARAESIAALKMQVQKQSTRILGELFESSNMNAPNSHYCQRKGNTLIEVELAVGVYVYPPSLSLSFSPSFRPAIFLPLVAIASECKQWDQYLQNVNK